MNSELSLPQPHFKSKLVRNILLVVLPLAIIPTLIMGSVAYVRARALLLEQISSQMAALEEKEYQNLTKWIHTKQTRLRDTANKNEFIRNIEALNSLDPSAAEYVEAAASVIESLEGINTSIINPLYNQFLIVAPNGNVIAATKEKWVGENISTTPFFIDQISPGELKSFIAFSPEPLYINQDDLANEVTLMTSQQILDVSNNLIGYAIGISEASSLQRTLEPDLDFLSDSSIYLINNDGQVSGITKLYGFTTIQPSSGQDNMFTRTINDQDMSAISYSSYDQLPVVGYYNYREDLELGLLIEIPQSNTFSQINSLAPFTLLLLGFTTLVTGVFLWVGIRRFLVPIRQVAEATKYFAEGDWQMRAPVERNDEIGLLAYSFNNMADQLSKLYQSMESEVQDRTQQIVTASEIAQLSTSATNIDELLNRAVNLIVERFGYYFASIFLLDEANENIIIREASGQEGRRLKSQNYQIPTSASSIIGWVVRNKQPWVSSNVAEDSLYMPNEILSETVSEVAIPIIVGSEILGVLDVQSKDSQSFKPEIVQVLTTLANSLASAIQNFRLLEGTEIDLMLVNQMYRVSRRVGLATSEEEIHHIISRGIQKTTFYGAFYIPKGDKLHLFEDPASDTYYAGDIPTVLNIPASIAENYLAANTPLIIRDVIQPATAIHAEMLLMPQKLNCESAAMLPIYLSGHLSGLIIIGSRERGMLNQTSIQPFASLIELTATALEKINALKSTQTSLHDLQIINNFNEVIGTERDLDKLYELIHSEIINIFGELEFYIALYDSHTDHVEIPYMYEKGKIINVDAFPLGEGLTSIVIRTKQSLMLVENTEERSRALGAKNVGNFAKSWLGVPLITAGEVIGVLTVQDIDHEHRFDDDDLRIMTTLSSQIAGAIHNAFLLEESKNRAIQLQTAAEIARDTSGTLERDELLRKAINLIRDRFDFYHASVFLLDAAGEYAVIKESTGEAGRKMILDDHKLQVGSQSIIGFVTANGEPLVANDVTQDPTHRFNPLLPDTRAELGIPLSIGGRVIGALDVQSVKPFAFGPEDISVLRILADQLSVAVANADLFTETQEHLAQHRLIHHVTTVAASSSSLDDALSSAVQGLRVTLGDRVTILLLDSQTGVLYVQASAGYEDDILGLKINLGQGITGWAADHKEPLLINDVLNDARYIAGKESVRAELAVPLIYRGELLGVLNVESDEINAFDDHDQDILGTLAGSLSAIIVNTRLAERQRQLFDVTNKIRRSTSIENILETTATELNKVFRARKTRIVIGRVEDPPPPSEENGAPHHSNGHSEEGDE